MKISKYCGTCKYNIKGEFNESHKVQYYKCEVGQRYFNLDFNVSEKCKNHKIDEKYLIKKNN